MTNRVESNGAESSGSGASGGETGTAGASGPRPRVRPVPTPRMVLCPFCGGLSPDLEQCTTCKGRFDPLSRQASQNAMGPWFIRNEDNSFAPGCSFETIRTLIARGRILPNTIVRGPTTNQFWTLAKRAPSIANLFGVCHNCQGGVEEGEFACGSCGAPFRPEGDRQHMGLAPLQHLPGQAPPAVIAALSGPPLGIEPIEVTRYGRDLPGQGLPAESEDGGNERPVRRGDDTRFWIILATVVIVVTILGAVFGPGLARRITQPAMTDSGGQDQDFVEPSAFGVGAEVVERSDPRRGAVDGQAEGLDGDEDASESDDQVVFDVASAIEGHLRTSSQSSLETALGLLRTSPPEAMSLEDRRRLELVIDRRLLRMRLELLP